MISDGSSVPFFWEPSGDRSASLPEGKYDRLPRSEVGLVCSDKLGLRSWAAGIIGWGEDNSMASKPCCCVPSDVDEFCCQLFVKSAGFKFRFRFKPVIPSSALGEDKLGLLKSSSPGPKTDALPLSGCNESWSKHDVSILGVAMPFVWKFEGAGDEAAGISSGAGVKRMADDRKAASSGSRGAER